MKKFLLFLFLVPVLAFGQTAGSNDLDLRARTNVLIKNLKLTNALPSNSVSGLKSFMDSARAGLFSAGQIKPTLTTPTLTAGTVTSGQAVLNWLAVANAQTYSLYRNTINSQAGAALAYQGSNLTYTNSSLTAGTNYYYFLNATATGYNPSNFASLQLTTPNSSEQATFLTSNTVRTLEDFPGEWFYDAANPNFITTDMVNAPAIVSNVPSAGLYLIDQVQPNWNGTGKTIFKFKYDYGGKNLTGGQAATGIKVDVVKGKVGTGDSGNTLTHIGIEQYVFDKYSPFDLTKSIGAVIETKSSLSGKTTTDRYYMKDVRMYDGYPVANLAYAGSDMSKINGLYGGQWSIVKYQQIDYAPVNSTYAGTVSVMFAGDSNTQRQGNAFLTSLQRIFTNPSATIKVVNAGQGGSKTVDWLPTAGDGVNNLIKNAVSQANSNQVTVVSISLGTNDVNDYTIQAIVQNMGVIADYMYANIPTLRKIVIQGAITPLNDTRVESLNQQYQSLGHNTVFGTSQPYTYLMNNPENMEDTLHPYGPAGYYCVREPWINTMLPYIIAN